MIVSEQQAVGRAFNVGTGILNANAEAEDIRTLKHRWRSLSPVENSLPCYDDLVLGHLGRHADGAALVIVGSETQQQILWAGDRFRTWAAYDQVDSKPAPAAEGVSITIAEVVNRALASEVPVQSSLSRMHAGSVEVRDLLALPLVNRNRGRSVLLYIGSDCTTHNLLEAVLRSSSQGMIALTAVRDVSGRVTDLRIIALNEGAAVLMRRSADQVLWKRLTEIFPDLPANAGFRSLVSVLETGGSGEVELSYPARDGIVHLKVGASAMGDLLAVNLTDIGDLKEREASFRLVFDDNPVPMWLYDPVTLKFVNVNTAAIAHYGYSHEQFLKMSLLDIRPKEDRDELLSAVQVEGLSGVSGRSWRHVKADGEVIEVVSNARPIMFRGQSAVLVAVSDVTERNRYASELQEAKELAEKVSRAKTDFLATMSHEIRTPLNGILGYADLLLDEGALGSRERRYLERIRSSGAALLTIVNDVLDFSKIEAGQIDLDPQPFSPRELVNEAAGIVSAIAEKKGVALRVSVHPDIPQHVVGDVDRLRQVLLNLLNNAVKFTPAGEVSLDLSFPSEITRCGMIAIKVKDTGIGIPADKREMLFQRFSQVDGSIRREFGGTGLGLAISKRLIELMGGEIGFESEEGHGSTFWFTVPLAVAEERAVPETTDDRVINGPCGRILLVEDNEINRDIASTILRMSGYSVDIAEDGAAAVLAAQASAYDIILMDVQMPVMDGISATQRIRNLDHPVCHTPIVAMTANVLPQQVQAFLDAGMNDHIGKPFRRDVLVEVISRWTQLRRASAA